MYARLFCRSGKVSVRLLTSVSLTTSVKSTLKNCVNFDLFMDRLVSNFELDKGYGKEFKTFVENRLREIRKNTELKIGFTILLNLIQQV